MRIRAVPRRVRQTSLGIVQISVSVGLIIVALRPIDRDTFIDLVSRVSPLLFVAAVFLLLFVALVQSIRWRLILGYLGGDIPRSGAANIVFLSLFFNQVLPSTIGGDAIRIWLARRYATAVGTVVHSVIADRVTGLAALALIAAVSWPFLLAEVPPSSPVIGAGVIAFGGIAATIVLILFRAVPEPALRIAPMRMLADLSRSVGHALYPANRLVLVGVLALVGHLGVLAIIVVIGEGLGLAAPWYIYVIVVPPVLIVSVLPISVAGWGVREGAMVVGLGLLAVPSEEALALSVVFGAVNTVGGLSGALIWVVSRYVSLRGRMSGPSAAQGPL